MNYLETSVLNGFPLSASTVKFLQEMVYNVQMLSALGGVNYILSGCTEASGVVSDGMVCVNGEVMPFRGSAVGSHVVVVENVTPRTFKDAGGNFYSSPYYRERYACFGTASIQYLWTDFEKNEASNALIKRMRLAEGNITAAQTAITGLANSKADKSNVLAKDNAASFTPSAQYHPATKKYVDDAVGVKCWFVGGYNNTGSQIVQDYPATPLGLSAARQGEGYYRIIHNLGHKRYFFVGYGRNMNAVSPKAIVAKENNYFDVFTSDDESLNDNDFYFQIFIY